jgi:hypothetical protein
MNTTTTKIAGEAMTDAVKRTECDFVPVPRAAVEWLKEHFPALTEKAGMCERIGGRLYTKTALAPTAPAQSTDDARAAADFYAANPSAALVDFQKRFAPQQPAQSAEQDERAAIRQSAFKEAASIDAHVIAMLTADGKVSREDVDEALAKVATLSPAHACAAAPQATNPDIESIQQEFYKRGFNEGRAIGAAEARAASPQSAATQPVQTQVALTDEQIWQSLKGIADSHTHPDDVVEAGRALLAAQPVSGGKS